jgi:hypothetical protein
MDLIVQLPIEKHSRMQHGEFGPLVGMPCSRAAWVDARKHVIRRLLAGPCCISIHRLSIRSTISSSTKAMSFPTWPFYALIPAVISVHLFVSPYTKVEESFNIQAIHDILVHGIPSQNADQFLTANYDHVSFPGSVPRTFAGALVLSGLSRPFVALMGNMEQVQLLGKYNSKYIKSSIPNHSS